MDSRGGQQTSHSLGTLSSQFYTRCSWRGPQARSASTCLQLPKKALNTPSGWILQKFSDSECHYPQTGLGAAQGRRGSCVAAPDLSGEGARPPPWASSSGLHYLSLGQRGWSGESHCPAAYGNLINLFTTAPTGLLSQAFCLLLTTGALGVSGRLAATRPCPLVPTPYYCKRRGGLVTCYGLAPATQEPLP